MLLKKLSFMWSFLRKSDLKNKKNLLKDRNSVHYDIKKMTVGGLLFKYDPYLSIREIDGFRVKGSTGNLTKMCDYSDGLRDVLRSVAKDLKLSGYLAPYFTVCVLASSNNQELLVVDGSKRLAVATSRLLYSLPIKVKIVYSSQWNSEHPTISSIF